MLPLKKIGLGTVGVGGVLSFHHQYRKMRNDFELNKAIQEISEHKLLVFKNDNNYLGKVKLTTGYPISLKAPWGVIQNFELNHQNGEVELSNPQAPSEVLKAKAVHRYVLRHTNGLGIFSRLYFQFIETEMHQKNRVDTALKPLFEASINWQEEEVKTGDFGHYSKLSPSAFADVIKVPQELQPQLSYYTDLFRTVMLIDEALFYNGAYHHYEPGSRAPVTALLDINLDGSIDCREQIEENGAFGIEMSGHSSTSSNPIPYSFSSFLTPMGKLESSRLRVLKYMDHPINSFEVRTNLEAEEIQTRVFLKMNKMFQFKHHGDLLVPSKGIDGQSMPPVVIKQQSDSNAIHKWNFIHHAAVALACKKHQSRDTSEVRSGNRVWSIPSLELSQNALFDYSLKQIEVDYLANIANETKSYSD